MIMITVLVTAALVVSAAGAHLSEFGKDSSGDKDVLNVAFNNVTVKFHLDGMPVLAENINIGSANINELLTRYSCKQELTAVSSGVDGNLEIHMEYLCEDCESESSHGDCSKFLFSFLIVALGIFILFVAIRARKASSVDGEVRWRLWRVPLYKYAMAMSNTSDSQNDTVESNDTLLSDYSIPSVLTKSMR